MEIRSLFFKALRAALKPLPVKRLRSLPFAGSVYRALYRAVKPSGIVRQECRGILMWFDSRDEGIARQILLNGNYEEFETETLEGLLQPGMHLVDIGANFGYFTLVGAKRVGGSGKVTAFEPEPANHALLCKNIEDNGLAQVKPHSIALSDREGKLSLFKDAANMGNPSLAKSNVPELAGSLEVVTRPLDEVLDDSASLHVDVIKMDVQGAEAAVLRGARRTLAANPSIRILMEFWPKGIRNMGDDPMEMLRELSAQGFRFSLFSDLRNELVPASAEELLSACDTRFEGQDFVNILARR